MYTALSRLSIYCVCNLADVNLAPHATPPLPPPPSSLPFIYCVFVLETGFMGSQNAQTR